MKADTVPQLVAETASGELPLGVAPRAADSPRPTRLDARFSPAVCQIYDALAAHQQSEAWELRELLADLHRWQEIMRAEFKLEIPEVVLTVERLRCTRLGHFHPGHNGFGLRGEIAINRTYVGRREYWRTLGTLLHELLHAWQQAHGRPGRGNYHNKEFQEKALGYGLVVDQYGHTTYAPESPFFRLLARYGVTFPAIPEPALPAVGASKLKKWTCGCTNVRAAVDWFRARCLRAGCGKEFVRLD